MGDQRNEAAVRARAYQLWVEGGYADGSQDANWRQAEREIAERNQAEAGGEDAVVPPKAPQENGRPVDGVSPHPSVLDQSRRKPAP